MPALTSPAAVLDQVAPAQRAVAGAMAGVAISSPHYQALARFNEALHRLAADLGHPGRLSGPGHSTPLPPGP